MVDQGQSKNDRFKASFTDSFGQLRTALVGVTTWTERQYRNSGIVLPHIAKNDLFSYNIQFAHSKKQNGLIADFHIHMIPVGAVTAGQKIAIDYSWGYYRFGDVIPDVLPNSGTKSFELSGADQYKHLYFDITKGMTGAASDSYSSFFLIKCQRRNDAQDTYAGEIAILGADCHYESDRIGSIYETHD